MIALFCWRAAPAVLHSKIHPAREHTHWTEYARHAPALAVAPAAASLQNTARRSARAQTPRRTHCRRERRQSRDQHVRAGRRAHKTVTERQSINRAAAVPLVVVKRNFVGAARNDARPKRFVSTIEVVLRRNDAPCTNSKHAPEPSGAEEPRYHVGLGSGWTRKWCLIWSQCVLPEANGTQAL